jgi:hypothetical protein
MYQNIRNIFHEFKDELSLCLIKHNAIRMYGGAKV